MRSQGRYPTSYRSATYRSTDPGITHSLAHRTPQDTPCAVCGNPIGNARHWHKFEAGEGHTTGFGFGVDSEGGIFPSVGFSNTTFTVRRLVCRECHSQLHSQAMWRGIVMILVLAAVAWLFLGMPGS